MRRGSFRATCPDRRAANRSLMAPFGGRCCHDCAVIAGVAPGAAGACDPRRLARVPRAPRSGLEPSSHGLGRERVHRQRPPRWHDRCPRRRARVDHQPHGLRPRPIPVPHRARRAEDDGNGAGGRRALDTLGRRGERDGHDGSRSGALAQLHGGGAVRDRDRAGGRGWRGPPRSRLAARRATAAAQGGPEGSLRTGRPASAADRHALAGGSHERADVHQWRGARRVDQAGRRAGVLHRHRSWEHGARRSHRGSRGDERGGPAGSRATDCGAPQMVARLLSGELSHVPGRPPRGVLLDSDLQAGLRDAPGRADPRPERSLVQCDAVARHLVEPQHPAHLFTAVPRQPPRSRRIAVPQSRSKSASADRQRSRAVARRCRGDLPPTHPPELVTLPDANCDLALLRWGLETLIASAERLGLAEPLLPRWRDVLANLAPFPTDSAGLMVGRGRPWQQSHRHYSHLLAIYPLRLITPDRPDQRALIETSLATWERDISLFRGYSFTGGAAMHALLGHGDVALARLNQYLDAPRYMEPNTFYAEAGPVIETPLSAAASIQELFLQDWGGALRVFPAVPSGWADAAFDHLRADGAFI